ncbi:MAG: aminotransferase class V-fold PLP-dependent enzyme [Chloroflexota bacterium]
MSTTQDIADVRSLFHPAAGSIYLDTATYGLPPQPTVDAMAHAVSIWQAGTAHWIDDWDAPADETRALFGSLIGAPAERVARIPQASVGTGLVAASLREYDVVVVPDDEFTSTLFPLLVAERRGVTVRQVPLERLVDAIVPGVTLVAASLVQMQTGRTLDLVAVADAAERVGARLLIDGTQGIPFVPLEGVIDRVDFLVCSGYKHLLCPRGVSFLVVREDRWGELEPLNANWRAADEPFKRYFGGPLTLAPDAARFDVSMGWISWAGALSSLRLLAGWKRAGLLPGVVADAQELAERLGVPWLGSTLVSAPIADAGAAREALAAAGVKASHRGTGIRFAPHLWTTAADVMTAAAAIGRLVTR